MPFLNVYFTTFDKSFSSAGLQLHEREAGRDSDRHGRHPLL